jgi:cytochrome P450
MDAAIDDVFGIIFAGYDTTSKALSAAIYNFKKYPQY